MSVAVRGDHRAVFEWWISPSRFDNERSRVDALVEMGSWEETWGDRSRTVNATWVAKGVAMTIDNRSSWDHETKTIVMDLRSEDRHPDGRVKFAQRHSLIGIYEETSSLAKVEYATEFLFDGQWLRRDFLPGMVGRRRYAHRARVLADAAACEKEVRSDT